MIETQVESGWETVSAFQIEFQRREHTPGIYEYRTQVQSKGGGHFWRGLQPASASRWIERQITHLQAYQESLSEIQISIIDVAVYQAGMSDTPHSPIRAHQGFSLHVDFTVGGLLDYCPQSYFATFYAHTRDYQHTLHLGHSDPQEFVQGQGVYSLTLNRPAGLAMGSYKLEVVVRLNCADRPLMGYLEVPRLEVM